MDLRQAARRVVSAGQALRGREADVDEENHRLRAALDDLEAKVDRVHRETKAETEMWKRKADDYFGLIESMEQQRDKWKEMWKTQSSEHMNAQAYLEAAGEVLKREISALLKMVNEVRKEKGQPALALPLATSKKDVAVEYGKQLAKAYAEAPPEIDMRKKRDEIAARPEWG